ncbi:MAG TPA: hypothetical protein VIF15_03780 [Polyangiaceae bacterium]
MTPESDDEGDEAPTVPVGGSVLARLRVGEETPPGESPCPACGAYYFALHAWGCDFEQCPSCGGQLATCGCV